MWKFATKPQSESSRPTKAGLEERLFPDMLRILCRLGLWLDPPSHSRDRNKLEEGIQKLSRLWELERKEFPSVQKRMGSTLHVLLAFLARLVECKVVKVALTKTKLEYELADHTYTSTEEVVAALVSGEFKGNAQSVESAWHTISGVWETESFDPTQVWEGIAKGRKRPPRATPAGQATESEVPANLNTNIGPRPTSPRQQASGEASRGEDPSQSLQGQPKGACRRSKRSRISPSLLLAEAAGLAQEGTSSRKRKRRKNTNSTPMAEATDDPETNLEILTNDTNHAEDSSTLVSSPAFSRASTAQQSSSSSSQSVASILTQQDERTRPACDGMDNDSAMEDDEMEDITTATAATATDSVQKPSMSGGEQEVSTSQEDAGHLPGTAETTPGSVGDSGTPEVEKVADSIHGRSENAGTTMYPSQAEQEASTGTSTPPRNAGANTMLEASAAKNGGGSNMPEAEQEVEFNIHSPEVLHNLGTAASLVSRSSNETLGQAESGIEDAFDRVLKEYARARLGSGANIADVVKDVSARTEAICREEDLEKGRLLFEKDGLWVAGQDHESCNGSDSNQYEYCLTESQVKLCLDAVQTHYKDVAQQVKDVIWNHVEFHEIRQRGPKRYELQVPALDSFGFLNDLARTPWAPIIFKILGHDAELIHKGCFLSLPGSSCQVRD